MHSVAACFVFESTPGYTAGPVFPLNSEDVAADAERLRKSLSKAARALREVAPGVVKVADAAIQKASRCSHARSPVSQTPSLCLILCTG